VKRKLSARTAKEIGKPEFYGMAFLAPSVLSGAGGTGISITLYW
jgi:hypothetical protein